MEKEKGKTANLLLSIILYGIFFGMGIFYCMQASKANAYIRYMEDNGIPATGYIYQIDQYVTRNDGEEEIRYVRRIRYQVNGEEHTSVISNYFRCKLPEHTSWNICVNPENLQEVMYIPGARNDMYYLLCVGCSVLCLTTLFLLRRFFKKRKAQTTCW